MPIQSDEVRRLSASVLHGSGLHPPLYETTSSKIRGLCWDNQEGEWGKSTS